MNLEICTITRSKLLKNKRFFNQLKFSIKNNEPSQTFKTNYYHFKIAYNNTNFYDVTTENTCGKRQFFANYFHANIDAVLWCAN